MTAIFVSHRSSDNTEAQALKAWLAQQGHERLFLDFDPADGIPAGVDWEQRLYQELRRCQALLIVLTPAWLELKWCGNELAIAREKGKAVFVVRVKACPGGPVIPAIQEVDLTLDRDAGLEKLARGLAEHGLDPRDAFDWKPDRPIYPGLAAFDIDDAAIFFGRSEESWQVVEALRRLRLQATGSPKLLLITGASGSGKSSLMRAGVLARLRKEPASWIDARPFRRGTDALGALAEALAWAFPSDRRPTSLEAITTRLAGPDGAGQLLALARELRFALDRPEATLVLPLDQAEELLAAERADDAAKLLDLFRATLTGVGNEILVIATIRSDRLGDWQQHASIKATADHGELPFEMLPLGPMPMARIGEIVRGPAAYEGLHIDDDLVDAIRADTVSPDALPLLAYTLQYLHRHFADDGRLTLAEYRSFGGLEGSVRSQADAAIPIEKLSEEDRRALQEAFVPGLVRATAQGGFSRSRALLVTLPARAEPFLRRLIDEARLLTTDSDPQGNVTVEVAHESLLRVWPTLVRWIAEDAESLRRLEAMQRAAHDWAHAGRGEDFLVHRDHRLSDAEALIAEARFAARLDAPDRDYLAACRNAQNRREAEEREAQERELRTTRELANRRRMLFRGAMAASVLLAVFAVVAALQWREANTQKEEAQHQLERANDALALGIWSDLDPPDDAPLNPQYRSALWRLARDHTAVRDAFIQHLADGSTNQLRFGAMAPTIVRSLGFDWPAPEDAEQNLRIVVKAIAEAKDLDQVRTLAQVASMLAGKLPPVQAQVALEAILNSIKDTEDSDRVQVLAQVLPVIASRLGPEHAQPALMAVLEATRSTEGESYQRQALAQAVPMLVGRFIPDRAAAAMGPVFALLRETNDADQLVPLTQAMQLLASHLSTEQAQGVLAEMFEIMRDMPANATAYAFAQVVPSLVENLAPEAALALLPAALPAFRNAYSSDQFSSLELAMQTFADKLAPDLASAAQGPIVDAMLTTEDLFELPVLAETLRTLHVTPAPDQVQAVLGAIVGRMQAAGQEPERLHALARTLKPTLQKLSASLSPEQAQAALATVLDAMKGTTDPLALQALVEAVQALPVELDAAQAQAALGPILDATKGETDLTALWALAEAIKALPVQLDAGQAQAALGSVLAAIQRTTNPDHLKFLAGVVQTLPVQLDAAQAQAALGPVLAAMKATTDPWALRKLAEAVPTLPVQLDAAQAQAALGPVLAAIKATTDPWALQALVEAVQALPVQLEATQAQAALGQVLVAVERTSYLDELQALAAAVEALAAKLDAAQAQAALQQILEVLNTTEDPGRVLVLARAVQALPVALTPEQAATVLVRILMAMRGATDPDQLRALAQPVSVLVGRLTSELASQGLGLVEGARADPFVLRAGIVARANRALADKLTPEHVQAWVDELQAAVDELREAGAPSFHPDLTQVVQALADRLTPAQARALWPPVADWIGAPGDPSARRDLAAAVTALAPKLTADQVQAALAPVRSALAWSGSDDEAAAWASAFAELLLRASGPNRVAEVVEVLKYPMAGGTGTEVLLDALQRADSSAPGKDAGLDANLDWLRQAYPTISLTAVPACPEPPPDTGLLCPNA